MDIIGHLHMGGVATELEKLVREVFPQELI